MTYSVDSYIVVSLMVQFTMLKKVIMFNQADSVDIVPDHHSGYIVKYNTT